MVYKRGKTYHYRFMIHGRRYRGTTEQTVLARARQFESLQIAEVQQRGIGPILQRAPFLSEFAARFMEHNEHAYKSGQLDLDTFRYYRSGWCLLAPTQLASMRVDQIGRLDVSGLTFPGGPSNHNLAIRTLRRMLNLAAQWGTIKAAPKLKTVREVGRSILIEPWMEGRLLRFAPHPLDHILVIMQDAGMRPEEVMRLRWEQVLWERDVIEIRRGKSKEPRRVPLSERVRSRLKALSGDSEWVFPSHSKSGHRVTVSKQWGKTIRDEAEDAKQRGEQPLPVGLVLYCSRHTFATDLLAQTGNLALVGKVLGHQDLRTTAKYLHPEIANLAGVINQRNKENGIRLVANAG